MTLKWTTRNLITGAFVALLTAVYAQQKESITVTPAEMITSDSLKGFTARDVISWAHLDDTFGRNAHTIEVAQADDQAILGEYVVLANGTEIVVFIKEHGYQSFRGPVAVRKRGKVLEVDVEITGKDGAKAIVMLFADGTMQGVG